MMEAENYQNISRYSPDVILNDLSSLTPTVYSALETANEIAPQCIGLFCDKQAIDEGDKKIIRLLYPSLLRAIVQVLLNSQQFKTQALMEKDGNVKDILDWECHILSNNGLAGKYGEFNYKILKGIDGKLPPPGYSRRKQDFYRQTHLLQSRFKTYDTSNDIIIVPQKPNVVYLWDRISSAIIMYLSCPSGGDEKHAYAHFTVPIEHPASTYKPPVKPEQIIEDIDLTVIEPEMNVISDDEENDNDIREQN